VTRGLASRVLQTAYADDDATSAILVKQRDHFGDAVTAREFGRCATPIAADIRLFSHHDRRRIGTFDTPGAGERVINLLGSV
jgi:hypothetical protein